jgi:hypothetical protein
VASEDPRSDKTTAAVVRANITFQVHLLLFALAYDDVVARVHARRLRVAPQQAAAPAQPPPNDKEEVRTDHPPPHSCGPRGTSTISRPPPFRRRGVACEAAVAMT